MKELFFKKKLLLKKYTIIDSLEFCARLWMGYLLIINSGVGIFTPLEELGMPEHIYKIIKGMWDTGFMMHLVKTIELLGGLLLILNIFIPIVLIALVPIVINIYGIHIFLFDSYLTNGLYMILVCCLLISRHWSVYRPLLKIRAINN